RDAPGVAEHRTQPRPGNARVRRRVWAGGDRALLGWGLEAILIDVADWLVSDLAVDVVRGRIRKIRVQEAVPEPGVELRLTRARDAVAGIAAAPMLRWRVHRSNARARGRASGGATHRDNWAVLPEV